MQCDGTCTLYIHIRFTHARLWWKPIRFNAVLPSHPLLHRLLFTYNPKTKQITLGWKFHVPKRCDFSTHLKWTMFIHMQVCRYSRTMYPNWKLHVKFVLQIITNSAYVHKRTMYLALNILVTHNNRKLYLVFQAVIINNTVHVSL